MDFLGAVLLVTRLVIGVMFVVAGVLKMKDPTLFSFAVRGFQVVPDPWPAWVSMVLPPLEILAGVALVLGCCDRGAWLLLTAMSAGFLLLAISAKARGLEVSCGCFGGDGKGGAGILIFRNILILTGLLAIAWEGFWGRSSPKMRLPGG